MVDSKRLALGGRFWVRGDCEECVVGTLEGNGQGDDFVRCVCVWAPLMQVPVSDVLSGIGVGLWRNYLLMTITEKAEETAMECEQEMMHCCAFWSMPKLQPWCGLGSSTNLPHRN